MSNSITSQTPLPHPIPASDELGPLVGKNFGGYEISSYIGEGPTGAVYRAEDLVGSEMAVKVMHRELSRKEAAEALWADLKKLSDLKNPHLVPCYDAGFGDEGEFYYLMDELVGCDLESGLQESGALSPRKALEILRQVCAALEAAHAAGVVHGGLKPRNIFLSPSGTELLVKVLDFGAARLAGGVDKGVIVGNPFYMAPEQFGGAAEPRTDVYALGVIMYELFSGTLPFAGPGNGQVMIRHLAEVPPPPPGVDPELGRIILRALSKTPAGRYGSVKQLREAIDRWALSSPAMLQDAAAFHVVARAVEAQAMKQQALSAPDATAPMPKIDVVELARATRQEATGPNNKDKDIKRAGAADTNSSSNSSESVEASLEDFISQANASFPTSDGWDLHTGDVELIDDNDGPSDVESEEHIEKPLIVKPRRVNPAPLKAGPAVVKAAAPVAAKAAGTPAPAKAAPAAIKAVPTPVKGVPVAVKAVPTPVKAAPEAEPVAAPEPAKKRPTTKSMPVVVAEPPPVETDEPSFDDMPAPVSAPARQRRERQDNSSQQIAHERNWAEKTDVVSGALPRMAVPWTANPLVIIGGLLAAFIIGAGLVFLMVRTMMPTGPVVVQAAPPQVVVQQAPAPVAPVVTPLPPTAAAPAAAAPVVTPLPPPAAVAAPAVAAAPTPAAAPHPRANKKKHVAAETRAPAEKPAAAVSRKEESRKEAPAKKESSKGGEWVDPFAQ